MQVDGVAAVVTGGASGLGAAAARRLAEAGAKIGILDANLTEAEAVALELGGVAAECDVSDGESTAVALAHLRAANGPARIVINCAGIQKIAPVVGEDGPMPLETFVSVLMVNLVGTFNVIRLTAADMIGLAPLADDERGVIINVASIAAFEGQPGRTPYCASKGGVIALTLPMAREFGPYGVRVMTISPGHFGSTALSADKLTDAQWASHRESLVFPRRLGDPSEFAAMTLHICENTMLNGGNIRLDAATRMPKQ